ncbi:UvrD-helicase domain-containing protein [Vibrio alginolyticus]|uniref:UvrD-helicase domain-containing protein n=1 Tax=Vibrio alginolyticus TaxID=663 RepID=UPI003754BC6D
MKYDFICITYNATKAIIQSRSLQSVDFKSSSLIVNISNGVFPKIEDNSLPIYCVVKNKGVYILHDEDSYQSERNTVTLDFKTLSFDGIDDNMKVTCIQKALRFCIKYWDNLSYSSSEMIPLESTKGIIFPFPTKNGSAYKIVSELAPFKNKANKERKYKGKHICFYKFDQTSGSRRRDECEVGTLKKALDGIFDVGIFKQSTKGKVDDESTNIGAINLDEMELVNTTALLGREDPFKFLSDKQLSFVNADWKLPARVHGPAGTGKTICLVLKALKAVYEGGEKLKVLFIVPSTSVRNTVEYFLKVTASSSRSFVASSISQIKVRTIQQVCMELLGNDISETELLDEDSYEAKQAQLIYVMEIVEDIKENLKAHKQLISNELYSLFDSEDVLALSELLIHEFGVAIKGRCNSLKDEYINSNCEHFCLPTKNDNDKYFIFKLFEDYQSKLDKLGQFDPDDVALSAIGKLESPLWKRRRSTEAYDFICADELHLLNFNELSIIHFLTKSISSAPISFAVDATQAIGDIAWKSDSVLKYLNIDEFSDSEEQTNLTAVFRCSASITRLASMITSSGTSLFTNFIDPLAHASGIQDDIQEYQPEYILYDESSLSLHQKAINLANSVQDELNCMKHKIVIIYFDRLLFEEAKDEFSRCNKTVSCLLERGDIEIIEQAKKKNDFVVAMADYVGGLEFDAVVLVGVDKGRFPREERAISNASKTFQNYTAHNRMYVAITRATKIVKVLGDSRRGESSMLSNAIKEKVITLTD